VLQEQSVGAFASRVAKLLERVEYRRADTEEDKIAIYRMRHEAYTRSGAVDPQPSGLFTDHYDHDPNAWIVGVYIDGELAGSLRLHIGLGLDASLPARTAFPDIIDPLLQTGKCVIDGTRFVSAVSHARHFPELPFLTLRSSFMAEKYFHADYMTAGCRVEHQAFYKRMFGCGPWAPPRPYPHLNKLFALVGYDCRQLDQRIYARYPYLFSSAAEQIRLFSQSSNGASGGSFVKQDWLEPVVSAEDALP
jgi:hypothetical protein